MILLLKSSEGEPVQMLTSDDFRESLKGASEMDNYIINKNDVIDTSNPSPRVPVCLCLDTSGSMGYGGSEYGNSPIDELNEGVQLFYNSVREDETAYYSAEICIVTFGGSEKLVEDFANVYQVEKLAHFDANGGTPMGEAVNLALDRLEQRKNMYKQSGTDYYQPWLVLMTDGSPNGSTSELDRSIQRVNEMVSNRKLTVFPIGIGNDADMNVLKQYSPNRPPLKLKGMNFREFFTWLSQSVSRTSQSIPGDKVALGSVEGWATL